jgi:uncharacterized protein YjeT (DUF2065 family)
MSSMVMVGNQWIVGALGLLWIVGGLAFFLGARRVQALSIRFFKRNGHIKFAFGTDWPEGRTVVLALRFFGTVFIGIGALLLWFALFSSQS